ncbi:MAG: hypothetical protein ACHQRM_11000 [Bacteroidia bacterium]
MKTQHALVCSLLFFLLNASLLAQNGGDPLLDRPGAGDVSGYTEGEKPFFLPNKLIQPPVYAWDKPRTLYTVSAQNGAVIEHQSGTKIYVPAGAFVDAEGNAVEGTVQIDYREFHDPVDFLFSGIPMTYDSGGATNLFESAGMFEIAASQNGTQVFLAKDKPVKMDFVSTNASTSYNFYVLDAQKGTWVNKGKTQTPVVKDKKLGSMENSNAIRQFNEYRNRLKTMRRYDTTGFEERFADTAYYFTSLRFNNPMVIANRRDYDYQDDKRQRSHQSLIRLSRVHSGKKGELAFHIKFTGKEFPEMRAFSSMQWVLTDKETGTTFRNKYQYRQKINDMRLEQEGDGYVMNLKSNTGHLILHAYPVTARNLEKPEHPAVSSRSEWNSYSRSLAKREKQFSKDVDKDKKEDAKKMVPVPSYWASLKPMMNVNEKKMSFAVWKQYCDSFAVNEKKIVMASAATEGDIIRSLEIDGMGVFNCDQVQRLQNPVVANSSYKTGDGVALNTKSTYIIDNRLNGVLRYDGYRGFSPSKIAYSPGSDNILISIREDGTIAWQNPRQFKDDTREKPTKPEFTVGEVDPSKMSVGEFRKMIGMK